MPVGPVLLRRVKSNDGRSGQHKAEERTTVKKQEGMLV